MDIPPPPVELHHGSATTIQREVKGVAFSYMKVRMFQNFSQDTHKHANPFKETQKLVCTLQKADNILLSVPFSQTMRGIRNNIDQTVRIPQNYSQILHKYFSHTVSQEHEHTNHSGISNKIQSQWTIWRGTTSRHRRQTGSQNINNDYSLYTARCNISQGETNSRKNPCTAEDFGLYLKRQVIFNGPTKTLL